MGATPSQRGHARAYPLALIALIAGCGAAASTPAPTTPAPTVEPIPAPLVITGTFTLYDESGIRLARANSPGDPVTRCEGSKGYSDIKEGLGVVVTNEDGRTIGSSRLTHEGLEEIGDDDFCALAFEVTVQPAEFYTVAVGQRGELTYSHAELEAADWDVIATLGE